MNAQAAGKEVARRKKTNQILSDIIMHAQQFMAMHRLGIYGKARLYLTFSSRLQELGYPEELVKAINQTIMVRTPR